MGRPEDKTASQPIKFQVISDLTNQVSVLSGVIYYIQSLGQNLVHAAMLLAQPPRRDLKAMLQSAASAASLPAEKFAKKSNRKM